MKLETLEKMNVKALRTELKNYCPELKSIAKMNRAKVLEELVEAMTELGDLDAPKEERRKKKRGPSTKNVLRSLFKNKKVAFTMEELIKECPTVKPNTIETAIVDLKNPKWAGGPVLKIARGEDNKYRIAQ